MERDVDLQAFWDDRHRLVDRYWLTGSTLAELCSLYQLEIQRVRGMHVTEIGVGTGQATRELALQGNWVTGVDISEEALARVRDIADCRHVSELVEATPADLAFCHLVFQHVPTEMVYHILNSLRLAPGGILCCQTAWLVGEEAGLAEDIASGGLFWHARQELLTAMYAARLHPFWERQFSFSIKGATVDWSLFRARTADEP